jgi:hypothetical protein
VPRFDFLTRVVKKAPFAVRGADGFGLKAIGKALHQQGAITTSWGDGPADGLGAMVAAWRAAAIAKERKCVLVDVPLLRDVVAYNEVDCRVMAEVIDVVRGAGQRAQPPSPPPLPPAATSPAPVPVVAASAPASAPVPMEILTHAERPIDELRSALAAAERLDVVTPALSLPASPSCSRR